MVGGGVEGEREKERKYKKGRKRRFVEQRAMLEDEYKFPSF